MWSTSIIYFKNDLNVFLAALREIIYQVLKLSAFQKDGIHLLDSLIQWSPTWGACIPSGVQDSPLGCQKKMYFVPLITK